MPKTKPERINETNWILYGCDPGEGKFIVATPGTSPDGTLWVHGHFNIFRAAMLCALATRPYGWDAQVYTASELRITYHLNPHKETTND